MNSRSVIIFLVSYKRRKDNLPEPIPGRTNLTGQNPRQIKMEYRRQNLQLGPAHWLRLPPLLGCQLND